jgi:hypothetical protein
VIPWLLTIVASLIGVWQFTAQQRQASESLAVEQQQANQKPFLEKQLEVSFKAVDTAAALATDTDPEKWEQDRVAFWRLYWGTLSIVEDTGVESAMVDLGHQVPDHPLTSPVLPMLTLGTPSYKLAHAVRELVLASWQIQLPPLQGLRLESKK